LLRGHWSRSKRREQNVSTNVDSARKAWHQRTSLRSLEIEQHRSNQSIFGSSFSYGKVQKEGDRFVAKYNTGQVETYAPDELWKRWIPLKKATARNLPGVERLLTVHPV